MKLGELVVKIERIPDYKFVDQKIKGKKYDFLTIPPNTDEIKIEALANAIRIFDPKKEKGKDTLIKILLVDNLEEVNGFHSEGFWIWPPAFSIFSAADLEEDSTLTMRGWVAFPLPRSLS